MSWFQSTNIASLAKTALKEAQKTIDKALEISDAPQGDGSLSASTTSEKVAAVTEAATDFFASWGVGGKKSQKSDANENPNSYSGLPIMNVAEKENEKSGSSDIPQRNRSQSLEVSSRLHSAQSDNDVNYREALATDIPVTLIPAIHQDTPEKTLSTSAHHQRSFSDTIFNLTTDFHESVQILDEPDGPASNLESGRMPVQLSDKQIDNCEMKQPTSHNNIDVMVGKDHRFKSSDFDTQYSNLHKPTGEAILDTLTTVDLNSADELWGYHEHPVVSVSTSSTMFKSSNTGYDSSWSWADSEQEASTFDDITPVDTEKSIIHLAQQPDSSPFLQPEIVPHTTTEESQDGLIKCSEPDDNHLVNTDAKIENTGYQSHETIPDAKDETDHHDPSLNSLLESPTNHQNETDDSQESSSGTVLLEQSSLGGSSTEIEEQEQTHCGQDDKVFKPSSSPPASSVSALDSPRSSSPLASNNEHSEDSQRDSPENNFEQLSHSSCHPGPDFLPESSRSSSIVVVSSARASSGGSGSTASTGSDLHRDIDMLDHNHAHQPYHQQNFGSDSGSTGYERVDLPSSAQSSDPTSPEFIKSHHRKGPSSASSSDIEVILSSELSRHSCHSDAKPQPIVSSTHQQTSMDCQNQETQTDFIEAKVPVQGIPNRVGNEFSEKDQMIEQLREEGEKLSKKQFDLSQVIKKLRAKEKEMENTVKGLKGELAGRNVENDRLTKSFVNKESAEKTLNDTVQKLTTEKRTLELQIEQIHSELEDAKENCASMKASVEDASVEILELKNAISSAQRDSTDLDNLTREKSDLISRNESLQKDLDNLRSTINLNQGRSSTRESELQIQISTLTRKVHDLQNQLADVSSEVADATMPLSLEIEKLQAELKQSQVIFERREKYLNSQVMDLETKWKSSAEKEATLKDQLASQETKFSFAERKLQALEVETRNLKRDASFREENEQKRTQEKILKISKMETQIQKATAEIDRLNQENEQLGLESKSEKASLEQERKRNQNLLEQLSSSGRNINQQQHKISTVSNPNNGNFVTKSGENSPSSNSVTSEASYLDEVFDPHGQLGNRGITPRSFFDSFSSTGLLEHLQSQLRQRESEVLQFQEEIHKNEKIRKSLNEEIAKLTMRNHEIHMEAERLSELQPKLQELEVNYNALLQLYGEKVEEADELRLDLQDVKDMYKTQIEQLVKR